jgi:MFS family permease
MKNGQRWRRVQTAYHEVDGALRSSGLDCAVLKGFAFCPDFVPCPEHRAQYDIDLLFTDDAVMRARDCVAELGYEPIAGFEGFPLDHLPTMIRKTGWEWRGDYFDPDIPVSIELHFRLWDEKTEGFAAPALDTFWNRRVSRELEGFAFTTLERADAVAYCCLHVLRHLLRGNLRPSHVYELGWFLEQNADNDDFWCQWEKQHPPELRQLQAICFELAAHWFECRIAAAPGVDIERLPDQIGRWLHDFAEAPLNGFFRPNKDELWLHSALLPSLAGKARVIRRRLLPAQLPGPVDAVYLPDERLTAGRRFHRTMRYALFLASRALHHTRVLPRTIASGVRWATGLGNLYWRFFATAALFDIGLFIFFLLYNIYVLRIGYTEQFVGFITSAMTVGSIAGSLAAAPALGRWGPQRCLLACLATVAVASALRAVLIIPGALVGLAAVCGICTGIWAVALAPTVAELTSEHARPLAFSLIFGEGIGLGVVAGVLGGRLPGFAAQAGLSEVNSLRAALLAGCAIVLAAMAPLRGFNIRTVRPERRPFARPDAALMRFLAAAAIWHLGTGAFNPFFNAFFLRLHLPVSRIGLLFSGSQLAQTVAVLAAPVALRITGLMRGVALMQASTAAALLLIAFGPSVNAAAGAYIAYMAFQYMSEPGMYSYLMNAATPASRTTASALNFVVAFGAQAIASGVAGMVIARAGYTTVIAIGSMLCAVAALLFALLVPGRRLLQRSDS